MTDHTKGILYAVITALMWGVLAVVLKVAVQKVDALTIVWFRFSIAFLPLLIWHMIRRPAELSIFRKPPVLLVLATFMLAYNYLGFMLGVHYTTPNNAQLFIQSGPILLTLAGIFFFGESINRRQIFGFILAMAGLLLFYNQQMAFFVSGTQLYLKGVLITLSAAVSWTIYAALQKKLVRRYSTYTLNLFLFGLPTLLFLPLAKPLQLLQLNWVMWIIMLFLGLNTLVAYTTLSLALKYSEAGKVSIIIILNPLITFAIMGAVTYLEVSWIAGEIFTLWSVAGALIVLAGAVLVVMKNRR